MRPVTLLLLLVLATPAEAVAQDDPCEGVSCSNHGTCVTKGGDPACACDEGFIPDPTTGLSCQPAPAAARGPDTRTSRQVAVAGVSISALSLLVHAGKVGSLSYFAGSSSVSWEELERIYTAWMSLHVAEMALHSGGAAMALGGAMAVRRSLGLKMTTPVNIAGWAFYAATWAIEVLAVLPTSWAGVLTFVEIPFIITTFGLAIADVNAARKLPVPERTACVLVPGIVPLEGGALVTLGGLF
jgi:hypothetical protein